VAQERGQIAAVLADPDVVAERTAALNELQRLVKR
jgi:hypothetical protein